MEIANNAVSLEVEHGDPKEQRHVRGIQIPDVFMQLGFIYVSLFVVTHNDDERKNNGEICEHGNVTNMLQSFQPAYWDENQSATHYVSVLVVAKVLLSFNANNLVQLVSNEYQVSDAKSKLRYSYA